MKKHLMFLIALLSMFFFSVSPLLAKTIKIGLMCPLTGAYASEGQDMKNIVTLLADELNAQGGINGDKVEIVVGDDGSEPKTSAMAAQKLSTQGVVAVIGTYGSANTEVTQNIYDEAKIIQIATGSTSVRLTEKGLKYFFRTSPRDDSQGLVAFRTVKNSGLKNIAVLHDNSSYAKGLADETVKHLKEAHLNVVFNDALTPKENDYMVVLNKIASKNPDMILFTGYYGEAGLLLKQKKEIGLNIPMLGGDATNNNDLIKVAGKKAAEGFRCVSPLLPSDLQDKKAKKFLKDYKEKYKSIPSSIWSVLAGDAFKVIVKAIEATKSVKPDTLADYLHNDLKNLSGLTGKISFDEKGDRIGDVYRIYEVNKDGQFILQ